MKDLIKLTKVERNTQTVNGLVVTEFIEKDNYENRYQILMAINPRNNTAKVRINNLDSHKTLYDGMVIDVQKDYHDSLSSDLEFEVYTIFACDNEKELVFALIIAVPCFYNRYTDLFEPDHDLAFLSFTEFADYDEFEEVNNGKYFDE